MKGLPEVYFVESAVMTHEIEKKKERQRRRGKTTDKIKG